MSAKAAVIPVFTESGSKRVFASALDWPGWARGARTEELALDSLADYLPRYELIVRRAGLAGPAGTLSVTERHEGTAKNADFGSLGEIAGSERRPLPPADGVRLAIVLEAAWDAFDETAATAPTELRKGPRGGGRDTAKIIDHVTDCEVAYARKMGVALPRPERGAADATVRLRALITAALREPGGLETPPKGWPPRYAARRIAWHVLDHLWEIEDKSPGEPQ
jgi:hypothetical protein